MQHLGVVIREPSGYFFHQFEYRSSIMATCRCELLTMSNNRFSSGWPVMVESTWITDPTFVRNRKNFFFVILPQNCLGHCWSLWIKSAVMAMTMVHCTFRQIFCWVLEEGRVIRSTSSHPYREWFFPMVDPCSENLWEDKCFPQSAQIARR